MNKSLLLGTMLGAVGVTAGGAIAGYHMNKGPDYAEVLNVRPVNKTIQTSREICHDRVVTHVARPRDPHRIVGTALGAALGGLVGSQFGGGSTNTALTVAGVVGGGFAGNKIQQRIQRGHIYTTTKPICQTVLDSHDEIIGYDVAYRLGEQPGKVRMDHDPGPRIPVHDGKLTLAAATDESSRQ